MTVKSVVTVLTPVFTAVAAIASGWLARHVGISFSPDELLGIEIATATFAGGAVIKFLHDHVQIEKDLQDAANEIGKIVKIFNLEQVLRAEAARTAKPLTTETHRRLVEDPNIELPNSTVAPSQEQQLPASGDEVVPAIPTPPGQTETPVDTKPTTPSIVPQEQIV